MSVEYWADIFGEIADLHNIDVSNLDINEVAKDLNMAANVKGEMCGDVGHFIDSKPKDNKLKERCEKLEDIIERLGYRFNVSVDIYRKEIVYMVPCGSNHSSSHSEKI